MDLYEILCIPPDSNKEDITKAYRKLAKLYHPDKVTGNTEKFQQINYAYNILIDEKTKLQYDNLKKPTKSKLTKFLEDWFKKQSNIKTLFKLNNQQFDNIIENIEAYDFNDILGLFNKLIIPNKKNVNMDCSDTDTPCWEDDYAEYYHLSDFPLKYHVYNKNNIKIELKCTIEEINKELVRKIKIKRKQNNDFIETSYLFKTTHPIIVFNNGGDEDGHLIINLTLPNNYIWTKESIYYNKNINLYEFIYGLDLAEFKIGDSSFYIPFKNGLFINLNYVYNYIYGIKLNVIYFDSPENKEILSKLITMK